MAYIKNFNTLRVVKCPHDYVDPQSDPEEDHHHAGQAKKSAFKVSVMSSPRG